jgi:hypothetical protein
MESATGHALPEDGVALAHALPEDGVALAHALRRETGGNPFFSAREVVAQRVASLGEETERALSMASVIGRDFDLSVLSAVLEQDELELSDLLDGATTAGLLQEVAGDADNSRFVHALIQHTLYQDLTATRRRRGHLQVAEVLEDTGSDDPERLAALAHHWLAATRQADVTKAVYYACQAGRAALVAYAPEDVVAWFTQALEVLDRHGAPEAERGQLLVELGIAQNAAGMPDHRQNLLDAAEIARRLGDADLQMAAALGGRRGAGGMNEADHERAAILQAALSALGEREPSGRALLYASLAEVTDSRDWRRRRELADEAVSLADELDDAAKLEVVLSCYEFRAQPERLAERLAETAWACQTADRLGDPILRHRARFQRIHACIESGDPPEVDRRIEEMGSLVERTGLPYCRWQLLLTRTCQTILAGDLATGERLNDEAFAVASEIGTPEALGVWGGVIFDLRVLQGRIEEMIDPVALAAAESPAIPLLRVALTAGYCLVGRTDEATPLFEQDVSTGFTEIPRDLTWTTAMVWAQESAVHLRHQEAAAILYDLLDPFSKHGGIHLRDLSWVRRSEPRAPSAPPRKARHRPSPFPHRALDQRTSKGPVLGRPHPARLCRSSQGCREDRRGHGARGSGTGDSRAVRLRCSEEPSHNAPRVVTRQAETGELRPACRYVVVAVVAGDRGAAQWSPFTSSGSDWSQPRRYPRGVPSCARHDYGTGPISRYASWMPPPTPVGSDLAF